MIFECGAHSREWLSPAVCLHIIDYLIYDSASQSLLEEYEFYILPLVNPGKRVHCVTTTKNPIYHYILHDFRYIYEQNLTILLFY